MPKKNSGLTRRKFISTAATGLATAGLAQLAPAAALVQHSEPVAEDSEKKTIYRKIGRTGFEVPIVGMGIMNADNPELIPAAYEAGMRYFHASANYQFGRVEENLGRVVNRLKVRDKIVVGTGEYHISQLRGMSPKAVREKLIQSCDGSLRRLGTDYIDILYVFEGRNAKDVSVEAIIEALMYLKDRGKIKYTGVATHSGMSEVINAVTKGGFYDVVLTAINFTMADDTKLLEAVKNAAEKGVGIVAMKIMAGGWRWGNLVSRKNYSSSTIAKAAMKWVMRNENIATCVAGFVNFQHLKEDFSIAGDLEYTAEEKKLLSDNSIKLGMGYCRQCRKCLASCPEGVDVPTLMRTHMYAAQYGDFRKARVTFDIIPASSGLKSCGNCVTCKARCANSVDIGHRIDELKLIYA